MGESGQRQQANVSRTVERHVPDYKYLFEEESTTRYVKFPGVTVDKLSRNSPSVTSEFQ